MYIADRVLNSLRPVSIDSLREAMQRLEDDVGAPVRILQPEDGREVQRNLSSWQGIAGEMGHYPGYTEEDRDERGITILSYAWNANLTGNEWRHIQAPLDLIGDNWRPRADQTEPPSFEVYGSTAPQIESSGGIPMLFDDNPESCWGAFYEQRLLYIHIYVGYIDRWGTPNWDHWFMDMIRESIDPEFRIQVEQRRQERQQSVFQQMMQEHGDHAIQELRERSAELGSTIGSCEQRLANDRSQFQTVGRQLDILLSDEDTMTDTQIGREWDALMRHTKVKTITFGEDRQEDPETGEVVDNPYMRVDSEDLWFTVPEVPDGREPYQGGVWDHIGRHMPLGQFTITLNFGSGTTFIRNNTHRMGNRWDHPHVSEGQLCTGEFGRTITQMLQRRQLAPMLNMIFQILSVTTLTDEWGGRNILLWVEHDEELRREHDWPAWQADEEQHPLLVQQEQEDTTDDR